VTTDRSYGRVGGGRHSAGSCISQVNVSVWDCNKCWNFAWNLNLLKLPSTTHTHTKTHTTKSKLWPWDTTCSFLFSVLIDCVVGTTHYDRLYIYIYIYISLTKGVEKQSRQALYLNLSYSADVIKIHRNTKINVLCEMRSFIEAGVRHSYKCALKVWNCRLLRLYNDDNHTFAAFKNIPVYCLYLFTFTIKKLS